MPDQEQDNQKRNEEVFVLSTGVELLLHAPSPLLVASAMQALGATEPKPPMVYIEDKGREEENPNDPDYIAALRLWYAESGVRGLRALIPTGSTLQSKPDHMMGAEDEDFASLMEVIGQELGKTPLQRYVQWVMYVAGGQEDLDSISTQIMRLTGVREEDVREALETFQGLKERLTNNRTPTKRGRGNRNSVSRSRSGTRRGG